MNDQKDHSTSPVPSPVPVPASTPSINTESLYGSTYQQQQPPQQQTIPDPKKQPPNNKPSRTTRLTTLIGTPLNKAAHLIGSEGWFPAPLATESDKAARILHSFTNKPNKSSAAAKIPPQVLQSAHGLAIFTTLRISPGNGSLATGSGIVTARRPNGTWSPPSAFSVTTLGAGFSFGLDIYEVVCVLNTPAHVAAFTRPRVSLGGELSVALGPTGAGINCGAAVNGGGARPVWSYMRSRGLWFGLQVDGTVIVGRKDANRAVYGKDKGDARDVLMGDVEWPEGGTALLGVLRGIDGMPADGHHLVAEKNVSPAEQQDQQQDRGETGHDGPPPAYHTQAQGTMGGDGEKQEETVMDEKARLARSGY